MSRFHGIDSPIDGSETAEVISSFARMYDEEDCLVIAKRTLAAIAEQGCDRVRDARRAARSTLLMIELVQDGQPPLPIIASD